MYGPLNVKLNSLFRVTESISFQSTSIGRVFSAKNEDHNYQLCVSNLIFFILTGRITSMDKEIL